MYAKKCKREVEDFKSSRKKGEKGKAKSKETKSKASAKVPTKQNKNKNKRNRDRYESESSEPDRDSELDQTGGESKKESSDDEVIHVQTRRRLLVSAKKSVEPLDSDTEEPIIASATSEAAASNPKPAQRNKGIRVVCSSSEGEDDL